MGENVSFDQEWAQLKSTAAEKQDSARTRLNRVPDDDRGGASPNGDLVVSQGDLAAVGDEAFKLYQRLDTDGDHAKQSTTAAGAAMKSDFALGAALTTLADHWNNQVNSLLQACAHISNHLDYTKNAHAGDEYHIVTSLSALDLNRAFGEGKQG
ncbi:hypothetical protein ACFVYD_15330 [Streptomyces sp. NPDC058301]|uniref:hypothetical protein n=1 Tax=Streptomyces sp. NPDC058301 TaxID=3346436 RepID=UPI0036E7098F